MCLLLLPYLAIGEKGFDIVERELIVNDKLFGDLIGRLWGVDAHERVKVRIDEQELARDCRRLIIERVNKELAAVALLLRRGLATRILWIRRRLILIHNSRLICWLYN